MAKKAAGRRPSVPRSIGERAGLTEGTKRTAGSPKVRRSTPRTAEGASGRDNRSPRPGPAVDRGRERPEEGPKRWGGVARRGAGRMRTEDEAEASKIWRETVARRREAESERPPPDTTWAPEVWVEDDPEGVRTVATGAVARGEQRVVTPARPARRPRRTTPEAAEVLAKEVGPTLAPKLGQRLAEATRAFERERFVDARQLLKPLAERAPGAAPIRELHGVTLYRLGRWREAARELEAFRALTGSTEQNPVLADSYRALKRYTEVDQLWEELRAASPSAELVTEGRIVTAGSLADRDDLAGAISLLEDGLKSPKRPRPHHLRLFYALADLYERAGDAPRARQLFGRVAAADPEFADVGSRLRALG